MADQALGAKKSDSKYYAALLPFTTRIRYYIQAKLLQWLVRFALNRRKLPPKYAPTYTKTYPAASFIETRVFIPPAQASGRSSTKAPLFLDVFGGGFTICDPRTDDIDNHILSQKHGIAVVAIGYRKGPSHQFPTAVYDVAALIEEVLADTSLDRYVDKTKVAIGGYSAGGNLSLTSVQLRGLHDKIKGVVAYYPVVDYCRDLATKQSYSTIAPGKKEDLLTSLGPMFNYAYIPAGTDYRNPLLSPIFAERSKLPKKIYFMGCQYDFLCREANDMADKLAEGESGEMKRFPNSSDGGESWQKGGIKWERIMGVEHGFNQNRRDTDKDKELKAFLNKKQEVMQQNVADWLHKEVFA